MGAWNEHHKPGDALPPPPPELAEWGRSTALATLAGMLYGGARAHASREQPAWEEQPQEASSSA